MSDPANRPPKLIPDPDGRNVDFYRHAAEGSLCLQQCQSCERFHHPPRYLCASCGAENLEFVPASGRGRIFSWTVTHRPVDPGWAHELPYATVVVEMDEGVRLVGTWPSGDISRLCLDLPVIASVEPESDAFAYVCFRPSKDEAGSRG